ncbi:hypothetical protein C5167_027030 [Papaver somniferum]|nr:hypothetical protein C5167_027030 [Papaver somniferum]
MMAGEIMAEKGNDNWIPIYLNRVLNAHQSEKNILYKEMNDTKKGKRYNRKTPEHAPEPTYVNSGISISGYFLYKKLLTTQCSIYSRNSWNSVIGYKDAWVYYEGRDSEEHETDYVMHEYTLATRFGWNHSEKTWKQIIVTLRMNLIVEESMHLLGEGEV